MQSAKTRIHLALAGGLIGIIAVVLVLFGNPKNMGFCIACFLRDIAGALNMHQAGVVQYLRPEVIGLVLGAFVMSLIGNEFLPRGGSSPMVRLVLGMLVMIGALIFLGCPFRMILRLAGGDLNALVGLAGFVCGIGVGVIFLNRGYSLKRTYTLSFLEGAMLPFLKVILLLILLMAPALLIFSESGPGSMHAPVMISLLAGLVVGALAQRTRLCMAGGIRDVLLFRDTTMLTGFVSLFIFALVGNLILNQTIGGYINVGFMPQPVSHSDGLYNFLGMLIVGWGSVLLGGCPLRQLIMAGEGNSDAAVTVIGLILGACVAHNFKLASGAHALTDGVLTGGPTAGGKFMALAGIVILLLISILHTVKPAINRKEI